MASDVTLQRDGRVAIATIDRASDQNRLTREVLLGLEEIVRGRYAFERSHDVDEGAAAHREGRTPRFTGR